MGMKRYLVGGALRDLLLGVLPREHDVAFEGSVAEFIQAYPHTRKVGRTVDVYLVDGVEHMPVRGGSITHDLALRDLTINALAMDEAGVLHAHPQALDDLAQGVLRAAYPDAFRDDPTRLFRVARFAARFPDFSVAPETLALMRQAAAQGLAASLPAERVANEVRKALVCPAPSRFVCILAEAGCLMPWFAELAGADAIPAGPARYHSGSVLEHIGNVMDRCAGDDLAVWMALCHDLGKCTTPPHVLPRHIGHELRGAEAALQLGQRLGMPNLFIAAGEVGARLHMKGGTYPALRPGTRVDMLDELHRKGLMRPFWRLVEADFGLASKHGDAPAATLHATAATTAMAHAAGARSAMAQRDLDAMLGVSLPPEWRNLGAASGEHLRVLRCKVLCEAEV